MPLIQVASAAIVAGTLTTPSRGSVVGVGVPVGSEVGVQKAVGVAVGVRDGVGVGVGVRVGGAAADWTWKSNSPTRLESAAA